jgi:hypothetical protein
MLVQFAVADTPDVNSVKLDPLTFGRHAEETILPLEGARPRPSRHDSVLRGKDIVNDEAGIRNRLEHVARKGKQPLATSFNQLIVLYIALLGLGAALDQVELK